MSLSVEEWDGLSTWAAAAAATLPLLSALLRRALPILVPRSDLVSVVAECDAFAMSRQQATWPEAWWTLSGFFGVAARQREAAVTFEVWPGRHFEEQVFLTPGTDVLADLEAIQTRSTEP